MSLASKTKRVAGDWIFKYQNRRGEYRLPSHERKRLAILVYHGLETDPGRLAVSCHRITPEGCLAEIRFFQRQGYRLVRAEELENPEFGHDDSTGYLLVSFDDGHANVFPHLKRWMEQERIPVLLGICPGIIEEDGIYWWEEVRARFHLMVEPAIQIRSKAGGVAAFDRSEAERFEETCRAGPHGELQFRLDQLREQTGYIDRRQLRNSVYVHENMNWRQIVELSANPLCCLASHSMHHEIAVQISTEELRCHTQASIDLIKEKTGRTVRHYVYPNGQFTEQTDQLLAELGMVHTYTTECALNAIPPGIRLNRLNGYDLEIRSLRHYGTLWKARQLAFVGKNHRCD